MGIQQFDSAVVPAKAAASALAGFGLPEFRELSCAQVQNCTLPFGHEFAQDRTISAVLVVHDIPSFRTELPSVIILPVLRPECKSALDFRGVIRYTSITGR